MEKGDVVRVSLPQPQGQPGREQFGTRPAIVVQVHSAKADLSTVVVVPFTSNKGSIRFAGAVKVEPTASNGLTTSSIALVHQIRAVDRSRIAEQLGVLDATDLAAINQALLGLFGL